MLCGWKIHLGNVLLVMIINKRLNLIYTYEKQDTNENIATTSYYPTSVFKYNNNIEMVVSFSTSADATLDNAQ